MQLSDRVEAVLSCIRGFATYDTVASRFGATIEEVQQWEAEFIRGGAQAIEISGQVPPPSPVLGERHQDVVSMLVHDLRSPLTSVIAGIELAQTLNNGEGNNREQVARFLTMAYRGINRVLETANSLLDILRLESSQMLVDCDPINTPKLFEEVVDVLSNTARMAQVEVMTTIAPDVPVIPVNNSLVQRAVLNLLDNAIKYAPKKSLVTLTASSEGERGICFQVVDRGPGIPEEFREKIFEKFVQVPGDKRQRRGSGLGLALCRLVAEAHQGRVWVEPNPEGGSIFSLVIQECQVE